MLTHRLRALAGLVLGGILLAAATPATAASGAPSLLDRTLRALDLSGDLRLRLDMDVRRYDASRVRLPFRNRPRVRLRLGATFRLPADFTAGLRLVTGNPADPRSPNQTLGVGNDAFSFALDRVYLRYRPGWAAGLDLVAGKFAHPFRRSAVYGVLVFDSDVQPTGIALSYRRAVGPVTLFGTAGEYLLMEVGSGADSHSTVIQAGADVALGGGFTARVAAGGYLYWIPGGEHRLTRLNRGNLIHDADGDGKKDEFRSDFRILEAFASVTYDGLGVPLAASAGYIRNFGAATGDDTGFYAGLSAGRRKEQGSWSVYAQYQQVAQESVFTVVSEDDFLIGTGFRGVVAGAGVRIFDWLDLHTWTSVVRRLEPEGSTAGEGRWQARVRVDLVATLP